MVDVEWWQKAEVRRCRVGATGHERELRLHLELHGDMGKAFMRFIGTEGSREVELVDERHSEETAVEQRRGKIDCGHLAP
ncbi:hypothetical protein PR202_ga00551 [Eleusine coracana subsp. coracana]|uniref:Uncharacterized protein n=1 Tax=Eleusine coracana subsp. coracana TaxID=191504 RepID=A0AAV5BDF7_ELECO|nr:hypothetical protein PR202_ga00551 [Eleusine coracana subsp. coracana]